jgi:chitinase
MNQLRKLKEQNPHLITMISIGGWTLSGNFSDVALTPSSRDRFARSAIEFMKRYGFDGIDIDWEYPVGGGLPENTTRPQDKQNYTLLLREVRRQLDVLERNENREYYLTIAAPAGPHTIANLELKNIADVCDWINLMTYDLHGGWENFTGHHACLYGRDEADPLSTQKAADIYLAAGVPPEKLVLGVPFYGRGWKNVNPTNNGLYQTANGVPPGSFGGEEGMFDYRDLVDRLTNRAGVYRRYWDPVSKVPYIWAPGENNGTFITYEDVESVRLKIDFIKQRRLGGIMFWELSNDTRDNATSLLEAISQGLR